MLSRLAAARRQQLLLPARGAPAVAFAYRSSSTAAAAVHGAAAPAPASASVLPDTLDRGSDAYQRNAAAVGGLLSDLRARVSQVLLLPTPPPTPPASFPRSRSLFLELALCLLIEDGECGVVFPPLWPCACAAGAARWRRRGGEAERGAGEAAPAGPHRPAARPRRVLPRALAGSLGLSFSLR